ncbi:MAG TPA: hypothetical protein VGH02_14545 [Rhizomicrobium sp.]
MGLVLTINYVVIPGLVPGIHFPEAVIVLLRLWKMGGRDKPGHDFILENNEMPNL